MNYTVVFSSHTRFGNNEDPEFSEDIPYGGAEANITFKCMNVAHDQPAIMLIEHAAQIAFVMTINGREIPSGVPSTSSSSQRIVNDNDGPDRRVTTTTAKRVHRHIVLEAGILRNDNTMHIFQRQGQSAQRLKEFSLGDIAVFFKISTSAVGPRDLPLNPEIRR